MAKGDAAADQSEPTVVGAVAPAVNTGEAEIAKPIVSEGSTDGVAARARLSNQATAELPTVTAPRGEQLVDASKYLRGGRAVAPKTEDLAVGTLRQRPDAAAAAEVAVPKLPVDLTSKVAEKQPALAEVAALEASPRRSYVGRAQIASLREDAASDDPMVAGLAQKALFDIATNGKLASKKYIG